LNNIQIEDYATNSKRFPAGNSSYLDDYPVNCTSLEGWAVWHVKVRKLARDMPTRGVHRIRVTEKKK
jgi:hypothetical protein